MENSQQRRTLLFAPETINLAEVTRTLEIAKVANRSFNIVFISYDGRRRHHALIEKAGFAIANLHPSITDEKEAWFWRKNRGEQLSGDYFTEAELMARIKAEDDLYRQHNPVAVVTGFCLSTALSARAAKIPLVWINQTTWLLEYFQRYGTFPDAIDSPYNRWPGDRLRDWAARRASRFTFWTMNRGFNKVAKRVGVPHFSGSSLLEGDVNLFAEPPGFSGIQIPSRLRDNHFFIGPLFGGLDIPIPSEVVTFEKHKPLVYFAMGSSGAERDILRVLDSFKGQPYQVIAPVKPLIRAYGYQPPENVIVTGLVPAEKINKMADISVIHGGIGTVFTACLAGTPIVGIPNGNPEQECNIQCIVRKGFGIHLHKHRFGEDDLLAAISTLLSDSQAKHKAREFQAEVERLHAPTEATLVLEAKFGLPGQLCFCCSHTTKQRRRVLLMVKIPKLGVLSSNREIRGPIWG